MFHTKCQRNWQTMAELWPENVCLYIMGICPKFNISWPIMIFEVNHVYGI